MDKQPERNEKEVSALEVVGSYETIDLPPRQYLVLSQVRSGRNTALEAMKDSVEARNLFSPIAVARMSTEMLEDYLSLIKDIWDSETRLEDLGEYLQDDGFYYLVIAGHTRHQAVVELVDENRLRQDVKLHAHVHQVESVGEILQIQLDENGIRSNPPKERQAVAVIEHYLHGVRNGDWTCPEEYRAVNKKVGKGMVADALQFIALPDTVRKMVLSGHVPYTAGVELGRAAADLRRHTLIVGLGVTQEDDLSEEELKKIDIIVKAKMEAESHRIRQGARKNSTAAIKQVQGWRNDLTSAIQNKLKDLGIGAEDGAPDQGVFPEDALFHMGTPREALNNLLEESRKELSAALGRYSQLTAVEAADILGFTSDVLSASSVHEIHTGFIKASRMVEHRAEQLEGTLDV